MEWRKKILEFEAEPPAELWEEIRQKLDQGFISVNEQLAGAEIEPPPQNWELIASRINTPRSDNTERETPLFHIRQIRWIAAAVLLGILFTSVYFLVLKPRFIKPSDMATSLTDSQNIRNNEVPVTRAPGPGAGDSNNLLRPEVTAPALEESRLADGAGQQLKKEKEPQYKMQALRNYPRLIASNEARAKLAPHSLPIPTNADRMYQQRTQNSYLYFDGPDGSRIRVSPKFRNVIYLLETGGDPGFDPDDRNVSENNYWRAVFSDWREKAQHSSLAPDGENFFDIVGFTRFLEENQ